MKIVSPQLSLPLAPHPAITALEAKVAIQAGIVVKNPAAAILDEPLWDWQEQEWRALVAITPWGPLVLMGFRLSRKEVS